MKSSSHNCRPHNGSPDLLEMQSNVSHHSAFVLDLINRQRNDPTLCDYEIRVNERSFHCHKCILIGLSEFFKVMLTGSMKESKENFVELKGFKSSNIMDQILEFIYSGFINLNFHNLLSTLFAASHLQIKTLLTLCSEFLVQNLNVANCASILKITDFFMLKEVAKYTRQFICDNIREIIEKECEQICQLSYENLQELMESQHLMNVLSELDLFRMLAKWLHATSEDVIRIDEVDTKDVALAPGQIEGFFVIQSDRLGHAASLIKSVRFMCMSADELCDHVEKVDFMHSVPECHMYLTDAYRWHALPRRQPLMDCEQAKLRSHQVLIAVSETNIYALNELKSQWDIVTQAPLEENYPYPFSVITVNNYLYVMGTRQSPSSEEYRSCFRFCPRTLIWTQLSPFLRDRSRFGIAYIKGFIYIFGGFEGFKRSNRVYLNTIDRYSISQDTWEEFSFTNGPVVSCMASCSLENIIYFGGGKNMNWSKIADFHTIDVEQASIETKAPMLSPRTSHQITVMNGFIYALGGFDQSGNGILNVEAYDIKTDQWSVITSIPGKVSKTWPQSIGILNESRLYISVFTTPNTFKILQKGYYYDLKSNVWNEAPVVNERARYCPTASIAFPRNVYNFTESNSGVIGSPLCRRSV